MFFHNDLPWQFSVESLDGRLQLLDVQAEVRLDLVVLFHVLFYGTELMPLLLVYSVEAFELPVGLRMIYSSEDVPDPLIGQYNRI